MEKRYRGLKTYQNRLAAIDPGSWPVSEQVDYHLVRAEMNGLEFLHRVLRPWSRDPYFYLMTQELAGPTKLLFLRYSEPPLPLSEEAAAELLNTLQSLPQLYEQAKGNLTEGSAGLATLAIHLIQKEIVNYNDLATQLEENHTDLIPVVRQAALAVEDYGEWLEENRAGMTAPAGIGKANFNWWMKNVQLFPYTWDALLAIAQIDYERAITFLRLEEHKNRQLPLLEPVTSRAEYNRRDDYFQRYLIQFIRDEDIFTVPDYLEPFENPPRPDSPGQQELGERDFVGQMNDRLTLNVRSHNLIGHRLDTQRHMRDTRPIRGVDRLYTIDMIRYGGFAYSMGVIIMHTGIYREYPRGRELNFVDQAFRAIRSIVDLRMHSNEFTVTEGQQYLVEKVPYGWTKPNDQDVWLDTEITLSFPGFHSGINAGKPQFFSLLADRADQLGDDFNLKAFMDEFFAAGMIPMSLTKWEMTGNDDEIRELW